MTGQRGHLTGRRGLVAGLLIVSGIGAALAGCSTGHALGPAPDRLPGTADRLSGTGYHRGRSPDRQPTG